MMKTVQYPEMEFLFSKEDSRPFWVLLGASRPRGYKALSRREVTQAMPCISDFVTQSTLFKSEPEAEPPAATAQPATPLHAPARHFGEVYMGEPIGLLPFKCRAIALCEGKSDGQWMQVDVTDGYVKLIRVIYNDSLLTGAPVVNHTLDMLDALRLHSYANNPTQFKLGVVTNADGHIRAWVDLTNMIAYLQDPDDTDKGIESVVYLSPDMPLLKAAKTRAEIDDLARQEFSFIDDKVHGRLH
ncbi:MAG TPA: hypothetical protein VFC39_21830 [Acidobacteriaceae bacterium]|nr:hypothetical protein [Acidobacteriaceae bacterium]